MDTKSKATFNPFQLFFLNLRERFRTMIRPWCVHCQEVNMVADRPETGAQTVTARSEKMIVSREIVSEPGDGITITILHLSQQAQAALDTGGARIPPVDFVPGNRCETYVKTDRAANLLPN